MPIFWSKHVLTSDVKCFEARRRYGGFMRHKIEVTANDYSATLIGGVLNGCGTICDETHQYNLDRKTMKCRKEDVAHYTITDRFMRFTIAEMNEVASCRDFRLQQEMAWSASLVLFESEELVGQFAANPLASPYRIRVQKHVPHEIVLLSIWIAMVRMAFTA